jgi:hypothetical protein
MGLETASGQDRGQGVCDDPFVINHKDAHKCPLRRVSEIEIEAD